MPDFQRYIGIDYSGAETAESSLKGLRVAELGCPLWRAASSTPGRAGTFRHVADLSG